MSLTHKDVLWVMQRRVYRVTEHTLLFCSKADFCSANLTSEVIFFNEIVRVASVSYTHLTLPTIYSV